MFDKAVDILHADTNDLKKLVEIAGGNPKTFFVGADFSSIDITSDDLNGYVLYESTLERADTPVKETEEESADHHNKHSYFEFTDKDLIDYLVARNQILIDENSELEEQIKVAVVELSNLNESKKEIEYAFAALVKNDTKQAIALFEKALSLLDPKNKVKQIAMYFRCIGALEYLNDKHEALKAYRRSTKLDPTNPFGMNQLGKLLYQTGDQDGAIQVYRSVVRLVNSNHLLAAIAYGDLGNALENKGDMYRAIEFYEQASSIFSELDHKAGLAKCYTGLGNGHYENGSLEEAETMYDQSLAINTELGRKQGIADNYDSLGLIYYNYDELENAVAMFEQALAINTELDNKAGMARNYNHLAFVHEASGVLDEAVAMVEQSLALNKEISHKAGIAGNYSHLGGLHQIRGEFDKALPMLEKALGLHTELGHKRNMAINYVNLGDVCRACGELNRAVAMYDQSLAINTELGRKADMAINYSNLGNVHQTRGELDEAVVMYEQSLAIETELGSKEGMASDYHNLGMVYTAQGDINQARQVYEKALSLSQDIGLEDKVHKYRVLIEDLTDSE